MSKIAWVAGSGVAVRCLGCDWSADRFDAEHDCPRRPENLEKVITALAEALKGMLRVEVSDPGHVFTLSAQRAAHAALALAGS